MAAPLTPNPQNCTMAELDTAIGCTPRKHNMMRLQAVKALLLGIDRGTVAELFSASERTVFDWIQQFNAEGIDGLIDRPRSGRPPKLSPEQSAQVEDLVEHPDQAGEAHWTGRKLHGYLRTQLGCEIGYSTVMRWLHEAGFRLKVPQPWPDRQDEEQRAAFVAQVREWLTDDEIELWYLDETGIEGDPRPRRRWIREGEKGRVTKNGDHLRMNVTGMVCPRTGEFNALEFTHTDTEVFRAFLTHANQDVACTRRRNLLICDNASWHKAAHLPWGQFEPVFLPPYSPDLNPIEKLWLLLKAEWFTDFVAKTQDQLIDRLTNGLLWLIERHHDNQRTCAIKQEL